jgi:hypothetical protein
VSLLHRDIDQGSRKTGELADRIIRLALAQKALVEHPHTDQQKRAELREYEESYSTAITDGRTVLKNLEDSIEEYTTSTVQGPQNLVEDIWPGVSKSVSYSKA